MKPSHVHQMTLQHLAMKYIQGHNIIYHNSFYAKNMEKYPLPALSKCLNMQEPMETSTNIGRSYHLQQLICIYLDRTV